MSDDPTAIAQAAYWQERADRLSDELRDAEAERDRLQAVVEAAQRWRASYDRPLADLGAETHAEHCAAIDALVAALDQLDGSGEEEGSVTPEEMGNPDWYSDPQGYAELEAERDRLRAVVEHLIDCDFASCGTCLALAQAALDTKEET